MTEIAAPSSNREFALPELISTGEKILTFNPSKPYRWIQKREEPFPPLVDHDYLPLLIPHALTVASVCRVRAVVLVDHALHCSRTNRHWVRRTTTQPRCCAVKSALCSRSRSNMSYSSSSTCKQTTGVPGSVASRAEPFLW